MYCLACFLGPTSAPQYQRRFPAATRLFREILDLWPSVTVISVASCSLQRRLGRCLQRLNAARTELRSATVEADDPVVHLPADSVRGGGHGGTDMNGTSLPTPVPIRSSGMLPSLLLIPTCARTEKHKCALHIIPNLVPTPT